jgi:hypothetical protein
MNNKQVIYQLIDNKYNDNKIDIIIDSLINNLMNNYNDYLLNGPSNNIENEILTIYNALKYNYKTYKSKNEYLFNFVRSILCFFNIIS